MGWITDAVDKQKRDAEQKLAHLSNVLAIKEKAQQQASPMWDQIVEAIKTDIEELNINADAGIAGKRLVADVGHVMVTVHPESEIGAIFTLEIDPTTQTMHYNCPVQSGPGVPHIGIFQMRVGAKEAQIVGKQHSNGPLVVFTPKQVSQFLFSTTLFPKRLSEFLNTLPLAS